MHTKCKILSVLLICFHPLSCPAYAEDSVSVATDAQPSTNQQASFGVMPVEHPSAAATLASQSPIAYGPVTTTAQPQSDDSDDSSGLPPEYNYGDDGGPYTLGAASMFGEDTDPSGLGGEPVSFGDPDDSFYSLPAPQPNVLFAQQTAAAPKPVSTKVPVIDAKGKKTGYWIDESKLEKNDVTLNGQKIEINPASPKPGQTYLVRTLEGFRLVTQPVTILDADGKKIGTITKVENDGCTIKFSDGTVVKLPLGSNQPGKPYLVPVTDKDGKVIGYRVVRNKMPPKTPTAPTNK